MRYISALLFLLTISYATLAQEETQTPYEIALERIAEAEASGATSLSLDYLGIVELPPEIGNLVHLQSLSLSFNSLTELPPEIGNLNRHSEGVSKKVENYQNGLILLSKIVKK